MTWVKIDDHFDEHPKLAAVGPVGWGIWLAGLAYCNRNLTDGFIPYSIAEGIGGTWRVWVPAGERTEIWEIGRTCGMQGSTLDTQWVIDLLLTRGLWEEVPDGYRVHDYEDYQPTKAQVEADRAAKVAAGRAGGIASAMASATAGGAAHAQVGAQAKVNPVPVPVPVPVPTPKKKTPPPTTPPPATAAELLGRFTPQEKDALRTRFPGIDLDYEAGKCLTWWAEGKKKMVRPKSSFTNWLEKAKEKQDGNRGNESPGGDSPFTPEAAAEWERRKAAIAARRGLPYLRADGTYAPRSGGGDRGQGISESGA